MVCMNEQDQGNLPLHHDTDVNDMMVTNTMLLRDRDCHLHKLHLWSCTTSKQGRKNLVELQLCNPHGQRTMGIGLRTTTVMMTTTSGNCPSGKYRP